MREAFRSLNWRKLILVSFLLGGLIGAFAPQGMFTITAFTQGYGGVDGYWCDGEAQPTNNVGQCINGYCFTNGVGDKKCKYMRVGGATCPEPACKKL